MDFFDDRNSLFIQAFSIDWNKIEKRSYLREIDALEGLDHFYFNKAITFLVGENGSGKSTLLEGIAIAAGFNPEGGTKNYSFSTYDSFSELSDAMRISRGYRKEKWGYFLRAESFYNVATAERDYYTDEYGSYTGNDYHGKSHGESFLAIAQDNFQENGLYILDEPEAALSPQRQLTLLVEIVNSAKQGSQFIIASHSPILLGIPDAEIISFDNGKIHSCDYEDTESYQVTKMFLENKEALLNKLLNDDYDNEDVEVCEQKKPAIDEEPYYGDYSGELPYETEAQELAGELRRLFDNRRVDTMAILELVIGYESDTKALLKFIKSDSTVTKKEVYEYALELYDARDYEDE